MSRHFSPSRILQFTFGLLSKLLLVGLMYVTNEPWLRVDEEENGEAIQDYLEEKTNQRTVPNVFISASLYHSVALILHTDGLTL